MSEEADYGYMACVRHGRVDLGRVRVVKRSARRVVLATFCAASGYRTHVEPCEVYGSEVEARAYAEAELARSVEAEEDSLSRMRAELERLRSGEIKCEPADERDA